MARKNEWWLIHGPHANKVNSNMSETQPGFTPEPHAPTPVAPKGPPTASLMDDPYNLLASGLSVDAEVLRAKFRELGLSLQNDTQEAAHLDWMRRFQGGTLSERKIVGRSAA